MQDHMFLWWPGKNCYSMAGKFWFIRCIHQILHLQISIYFGLYKMFLMEKFSIPLKTVKGTWNSFLLRKIKSFGKMKLWSCLKNETKEWTCCSIKFLVKMKNVFYFCLKTEGTFWPTQYFKYIWVIVLVWSTSLNTCGHHYKLPVKSREAVWMCYKENLSSFLNTWILLLTSPLPT